MSKGNFWILNVRLVELGGISYAKNFRFFPEGLRTTNSVLKERMRRRGAVIVGSFANVAGIIIGTRVLALGAMVGVEKLNRCLIDHFGNAISKSSRGR